MRLTRGERRLNMGLDCLGSSIRLEGCLGETPRQGPIPTLEGAGTLCGLRRENIRIDSSSKQTFSSKLTCSGSTRSRSYQGILIQSFKYDPVKAKPSSPPLKILYGLAFERSIVCRIYFAMLMVDYLKKKLGRKLTKSLRRDGHFSWKPTYWSRQSSMPVSGRLYDVCLQLLVGAKYI